MASRSNTQVIIQVVLALVIVGLAYLLYRSITDPYEVIEQRERMTEITRARLDDIRQGLTRYENMANRYPGTLDSLVAFLQSDTMGVSVDSLLGEDFNPDSLERLPRSPRTGEPFVYSVNDTGRVDIYLLKDPNSEDQIGSETPNRADVNVASWE